jgi:hypothetical protein
LFDDNNNNNNNNNINNNNNNNNNGNTSFLICYMSIYSSNQRTASAAANFREWCMRYWP